MILQLKSWKPRPRRLTSLVGLALDGSRLDGAVLRRTNGSVQVVQTFSATLSLDPLTSPPELVGREIRNQLDAAGVRERQCVVCVPLKWALTAHTEMPDLLEADVPGFLAIEAERGFHSDVETLHYATSRFTAPDGRQHVTLVGIPRNHVALLEQALRAAKLKPLSFSLGVTALQSPAEEASNGVLALTVGETSLGLQIAAGGGIASLRALEGVLELEGSRRVLHAEAAVREARITLGQLGALRDRIRVVRIFGPNDLAQQLADELELRLEAMGLKIDVVKSYAPGEFGVSLPPDAPVSPAVSLATRFLAERKPALEFLPPHVPAWRQLTSRYTSGRTRLALSTAALLLLLGLGMFLFQQVQIFRLQSQWNAMSAPVGELQALQNRIQQYRPWHDDSLRSMAILRQLTLAFPEGGEVSAKTLEIREQKAVTCTGTARDNTAWLRTIERLRASEGVANVRVRQIRGTSPMQFTFDFQWAEGGGTRAN